MEHLGDDATHLTTSLQIFRKFLVKNKDGTLDATRIISPECYQAWLSSRKAMAGCPERAFQRALSAHVTGVDGRTPFNQDEEEAILKVMRKKERWACFTNNELRFGEKGFRTKGYHEKNLIGLLPSALPKKRAKTVPETKPRPNLKRAHLSDSSETSVESTPDQNTRSLDDSPNLEINSPMKISSQPLVTSNQKSSISEINSWLPRLTLEGALNWLGEIVPFYQAKLGDQFWDHAYSTARFVLLAWGFFGANSENDLRCLMDETSAAYPGEYVLLLDFFRKEYKDRIVLQNDVAVDYFGRIAKEFGGFTDVRFASDEMWQMYRTYIGALTHKGQEVSMVWKVKCFGRYQYCQSFVRYDSKTGIFVEHGRLFEG